MNQRDARESAAQFGSEYLSIADTEVFLFGITHWHPACAWRILRALEELRPDQLAVEIPAGLEPVAAEALTTVFPRELGCAVAWPREGAHSDQREALVFSAGDAITHACLWAMRTGVRWVGIDLAERMNPHEPEVRTARFPDPWAGYLASTEYARTLDASLADAPIDPDDLQRERHMVASIRRQAGTCRRMVVIVGAAHRERIRSGLLAPAQTVNESQPPANAEIARLDGASLQTRFLGPLPQLSLRLHAVAAEPARLAAFDPCREVEELVTWAVKDYGTLRGQEPAPGQLDRFWRIAWKPILGDARVLPGALELCRAAAAAVDEDFAILVSRRCFGTLGPAPTYRTRYRALRAPSADTELMAPEWWVTAFVRGRRTGDSDELALREWLDRLEQGGSWLVQLPLDGVPPRRTTALTSNETWHLWQEATRRVRALAHVWQKPRSGPWRGGPVRQLDVAETIHARACGRKGIWVQQTAVRSAPATSEVEDFEPIVWCFESGMQYSRSGFVTRDSTSTPLATSHIYGMSQWNLGLTTRWTEYLGGRLVLAPADALGAPARSRALFLRWLSSSGRRLPRQFVWDAGSEVLTALTHTERIWVGNCPPHERLLLGGIHFARRRVLYVRPRTLPAPSVLRGIARRRNIEIIEIDVRELGAPMIRRLRRFEFG